MRSRHGNAPARPAATTAAAAAYPGWPATAVPIAALSAARPSAGTTCQAPKATDDAARLTATSDGLAERGTDDTAKRLRSDHARKARGYRSRSQGGEVPTED